MGASGARVPRVAAAAALAMLAILSLTSGAAAQLLRVELRAGAAVGNYSETDAGLDIVPGPTFGASLELWPAETVAAYVALNRSSFGCEEALCTGRDVSMTSQGVVVGGRWSPGLPWVRAGLALQALDIRTTNDVDSTDPGLGVELAAGVDFPVWGAFRIRPGFTYLRHGTSADQGDGHVGLFALEVGGSVEVHGF